jgi:hypothetical protein
MVLAAPALSGTTVKDFSNVPLGTASPSFTWTIRNAAGASSTGALSLSNSDPPEVAVNNGCTGVLAGGASCTVSVTFTPTAPGTRSATIVVSAQPGGSVMLSLTATGTTQVTVTTVGKGTVTSVPAGIVCPGTCSATFTVPSVTLQARTTNGSSSFFTGWSDPSCKGPFHDCTKPLTAATLPITATFSAMNANLIFGTVQTFPTNLGGTAPYDAACNSAATAAGINTSAGTGYIAWLSGSGSNAGDRLSNARGWVRLDGRPFTDTKTGLLTNHQIFYPFLFLEDGSTTSFAFPTATNADGTASPATCNNWTSLDTTTNVTGTIADAGPVGWVQGASVFCGSMSPLICMGITQNAVVTVPAPGPGRKLWVSSTPFIPNSSTTPNSLCQSVLPTGVSGAAALIATTTTRAADLVVPTTSYYRPDGAFIGTGADVIMSGQRQLGYPTLTSGVWETVGGSYPLDMIAWTGSSAINTVGSVADTCGNWTDPTLVTGIQGLQFQLLSYFWMFSPFRCGTSAWIYCVQTAP